MENRRVIVFFRLSLFRALKCPLGCGQWDARPTDGLNVPVDGSPGHFITRRQLGHSDFILLEQDRNDPNQAVDFHDGTTVALF